MSRYTALLLAASAFAGGCRPRATPEQPGEVANIEGLWEEENPKGPHTSLLLILGDRIIEGKAPEFREFGTLVYRLDARKRPMEIDMRLVVPDAGPTGHRTADPAPGICELDGDRLRICFPAGGVSAPRPTQFVNDPPLVLWVAKRKPLSDAARRAVAETETRLKEIAEVDAKILAAAAVGANGEREAQVRVLQATQVKQYEKFWRLVGGVFRGGE